MVKLIFLLFFVSLILFSVRSQVIINQRRQKDLPEIISSPFSQALTQLLGIAGGIYLSLVLLTSFLGIDIPEKITFAAWSIDPLALISLLIAMVQPFVLHFWQSINLK